MKAGNHFLWGVASAALWLISPAAGATEPKAAGNPAPVVGAPLLSEPGPHDAWQVQLELARRLRREQDFTQADQCLTALLAADGVHEELVKTALLDLVASAREQKRSERALQILAQYIQRFPQDPAVPELQLQQGYLFRELGAYSMALSKFYAVMTTVLNLKLDAAGTQQRLVLQAQIEIAETNFQQGKYADAVEFLERLLRLDVVQSHRSEFLVKLMRCADALQAHADVIRQAREFLAAQPAAPEEPEARFLLIRALVRSGETAAALREAVPLMTGGTPAHVWRQRLANEIGNELYLTGDYENALQLYVGLLTASPDPAWRVPVLYQIGLCHERLQQPANALKAYDVALNAGAVAGGKPAAPLQTVLDLLQWRKNYVAWHIQATEANLSIQTPARPPPAKP